MGEACSQQGTEQGRVCRWVSHLDCIYAFKLTGASSYYSEIGIGVKMDAEEAKMWYLRAAGKLTILVRLL